MGAGPKKPVNIFKLQLGDEPREVLNWKLWFAVFSFGIMGAARGIDEGLISGTFNSKGFQKMLHLDTLEETEYANIEGNVSAMVQIGSVGGALLAFVLADRIGRLWATRQLCLLWILGVVIFMTNGGRLGQVYAGRLIMGLGIGQTTVIAPVYISEIAPKAVRGLCTCVFAGSVYIGIMLAYFASWGSSLHIDKYSFNSWGVPTSMHIMFAGLIFILSWFNKESPRYLIKQNKVEQAVSNLCYVRNLPEDHELVVHEVYDIKRQLATEQEATMGQGVGGLFREIFCIRDNAYRLYLGFGSQLLSQWSGAQSITIYAPTFFALLGTKGQNEKLFATAIFGVVKFISSIACALFVVDMLGRKRALFFGITLQAVSMCYIASFLSAVPGITEEGFEFSPSQKHASTAGIVMIYLSGVGWAAGWNSIQYLLNAEIYSLRVRATCSGLTMCFHFLNQYGNSRAVPQMLLPLSSGGLGPAETFWLFTAITLLGLVWAWFSIPETAGLSLEQMDFLFTLKWYRIGIFGRKEAERRVTADQEQWVSEKTGGGEAGTEVEYIQEGQNAEKRV